MLLEVITLVQQVPKLLNYVSLKDFIIFYLFYSLMYIGILNGKSICCYRTTE